ncbi:MAG TPA: hypothetical protein VLF20_06225, partial [Patescibacteria group bacterium]|nr:hypothetical protein [Patescibacteria group bacterium]
QAVDKPLASIFHNQFVGYSRDVLSGYLSHYDFKWIFLEGDLPRHHVPFMGLLYLWELPFLLVGFYILLFGTFSVRTKLLVFLWFFLAPVPAAITHDVPHAVRTLNFLPTFQVFIALGVLQAILFIKHNQKSRITNYGIRLIAIIYFLFVTGNFFYYLNQYFVQQNHFYSREWQYGYKEAVASVKSLQNKYSKVVVSNQVPLDQSYMYFLFYLKYSPQEYQQTSKKTDAIRSFDKYEFRPIIWVNEEKDNNALFVGRPEDFGEGAEILRTIHYLDGKPAIVIGER